MDMSLDSPSKLENDDEKLGAKRKLSTTFETSTVRDRSLLNRSKRFSNCEANFVEVHEPCTYNGAINSDNSKHWKEDIKEEFKSHEKNHTWEVADCLPGAKSLETKWVFKVQYNAEGLVRKYRARLCAKGYSQRHGIDYDETLAPVVKYDSLRALLAMATHYDLDIIQFDVKTAFFYGKLIETIFIKLPPGLQVYVVFTFPITQETMARCRGDPPG